MSAPLVGNNEAALQCVQLSLSEQKFDVVIDFLSTSSDSDQHKIFFRWRLSLKGLDDVFARIGRQSSCDHRHIELGRFQKTPCVGCICDQPAIFFAATGEPTMSTRLPNALQSMAKVLASQDNAPMRQFIAIAWAEKLSAVDAESYF